MKKLIAFILTLAVVASMSVTAFAAQINQDSDPKSSDTVITTSIAPTYTVTIPADTKIDFNAVSQDFGSIKLESARLNPRYAVKVSANAGVLTNEEADLQTIPYELKTGDQVFTSQNYDKAGEETPLTIEIKADDWNKAAAGSYKGTVTFTIEYCEVLG